MRDSPATDAVLSLPRLRLRAAGISVNRPRVHLRHAAGLVAVLGLLAATATVVLVAASGPTPLVPRSEQSFPAWVAGPLHGLLKPLSLAPATTVGWFSLLVVAMLLAYAVALLTVSALSTRVVIVSIVALHVVLLLSPPLQLEDVFNYLGYARLGALHGLNPYTHVVAQAAHDPVYSSPAGAT